VSDLEKVILDNTGWLLRYMKSKAEDLQTAEDLVQEVWLRVFIAWDRYHDDGHLTAWLKKIAQNVWITHVRKKGSWLCLSLDADEDDDSLSDIITDGVSAEDEVIANMLSGDVIRAIEKLPEAQKQVLTYRYILDMTIPETAQMLNISPGTVKSASYYGLANLRRQLSPTEQNKIKQKGVKNMSIDCREAEQYLFVYAKGLLPEDIRDKIKKHLDGCETCRNVAIALEKLIPQMPAHDENCTTHFSIDIPDKNINYTAMGNKCPNAEQLNKSIKEWGGHIPEEVSLFESGHNTSVTEKKTFDNEGNEIKYRVIYKSDDFERINVEYITKIYPYMWEYSSLVIGEGHWCKIEETEPGVYHGYKSNGFGGRVKSGLYQLFDKNATNIQMIKGLGILDCGTYYAAYTDRYAGDNEYIELEYTFNV